MSTISMGLTTGAPILLRIRTTVVVTSLTEGMARPGETVGVSLSNHRKITGYAWGSSPGAADYGTEPTLQVPEDADGKALHVTVETEQETYATSFEVRGDPVLLSSILPGAEEIIVQSLIPAPVLSALTMTGDTDAITVEFA